MATPLLGAIMVELDVKIGPLLPCLTYFDRREDGRSSALNAILRKYDDDVKESWRLADRTQHFTHTLF